MPTQPIETTTDASTSDRRTLLKGAGFGAAVAAFAALGLPAPSARAQSLTDADILNFALNLEYLEAEFYLQAAFGKTLTHGESTGVGTLGKVTGGAMVPFTDTKIMQYAQEIARDELDHVLFLRSALGSAAVARPAINLQTSFTTLAQAAGFIKAGQTFDPFASDANFLIGAFVFEDVGVTAYHGAATAISNPAYLTAAAGILAVEAYHASLLRVKLFEAGLAAPVAKISALRAKLSGAADDQGVVKNGHANIVPVDANAIVFSRTPQQVLNVVYGGGASSDFLFFPDKLNGAIS
jgi:hypothetical protein